MMSDKLIVPSETIDTYRLSNISIFFHKLSIVFNIFNSANNWQSIDNNIIRIQVQIGSGSTIGWSNSISILLCLCD